MTNHLMMTQLVEEMITSAGADQLCLISPDPLDAALLNEQTGYAVPCYNALPSALPGIRVIMIPIAMEGFFELLQQIDRSSIKVIAIINDLAEEFMAAKFIGVGSVLRVTLRTSLDLHKEVFLRA